MIKQREKYSALKKEIKQYRL